VHCLIDATGSRNFIHDHPALLTSLQTQIRIKASLNFSDNCIVFDRKLAVIGGHDLCEPDTTNQFESIPTSRIIKGTTAAEIATRFDAEWK
jgi:hypothetical protein